MYQVVSYLKNGARFCEECQQLLYHHIIWLLCRRKGIPSTASSKKISELNPSVVVRTLTLISRHVFDAAYAITL